MTTTNSQLKTSFVALILFFGLGLVAALTQASVSIPNDQPPPPTRVADLNIQTQNFVFFFTKTFLDRDKTQITIPYGYDNTPPILFLGYTPQDQNQRDVYLISHPQINDLSWPIIREGDLSLYQKTPTYSSISEFLQNPPNPQQVAIDPELNDLPEVFLEATTTEATLDLDSISYILTNFKPSTLNNGVYVYENIIDATSANLDEQNQIEWFIKAPLADQDNPYKLGNIQIDYLQ